LAIIAVVIFAAPLLLLLALQHWPREPASSIRVVDVKVIAWCALETVCQVMVYAIALRALGVPVAVATILALSPILFLADLIMITPSGLGLREALFGAVLPLLSGAAADTGVAAGLLVSTMLITATLVGGGLALLLPREVSLREAEGEAEGESQAPD
jgi:uncharacterized membrane protein YbhN (UPF0104 family)